MKTSTRFIRSLVTVVVLLTLLPLVRAQNTDFWTGGGGNRNLLWLNAANWTHLPQSGDFLIFTNNNSLANTNNYPTLQNFGSITFANPAGAFVLNPIKTNSSLTITNITDLQPITPETINLPLIVNTPGNLNVNVAPSNGVVSLNNVLSGTGSLVSYGTGTLNLNGSNTFAGPLVVTAGTVAISQETNLPVPPGSPQPSIYLNGGALKSTATFALNPNRQIVLGPSSGSGVGIINVSSLTALTNNGAMVNNGGGTGSLTKVGFGDLDLSGVNTYTGPTTNTVGMILLDFTQPSAPANNIINSLSTLTMGGGNAGPFYTNGAQLVVAGTASGNTQAFAGSHFTFGASVIGVTNLTGSGLTTLNLGAVSHDPGGALAVFSSPEGTAAAINTASPNVGGILGGWALYAGDNNGPNIPHSVNPVSGTNYVAVDGSGNFVQFNNYYVYQSQSQGTLKSLVDANTTGVETNILISTNASFVIASVDNPGAGTTTDINSIKFYNLPVQVAGSGTGVLIDSNNVLRLGVYGGILSVQTLNVTPIIGGVSNMVSSATDTGSGQAPFGSLNVGTLTAGGPNDNTAGEIVITHTTTQGETTGGLLIPAKITDNGSGVVTVVKVGNGSIKLDGNNTYSGGLYLLQGRVQFAGPEVDGTGASQGGPGGTNGYNPDAGGTGPVYVLPGCYLFPNIPGGVSSYIANHIFIAGGGDAQENFGVFRGGSFSGEITMIGDATIGADGPILFYGPVDGPFNLTIGPVGRNGIVSLINSGDAWSGNTTLQARNSLNMLESSNNEVIPNGFGFGNVNMTGAGSANFVWAMNGFSETVNGFSTSGSNLGGCVVSNGFSQALSTLTIGDNGQSGQFGGILKSNIALTKIGTGVETFTNVNTYAGITTISNGSLALSGLGTIALSPSVNINGGTFDVSQLTSYAIPASQTINVVNGGTFFLQGASGSTTVNFTNGTLQLANQFGNSAELAVSTISLGSVGNTTTIEALNPPPIGAFPIAYPIISYSSGATGSGSLAAILPAGYGGYATNVSTVGGLFQTANEVYLVLTNGPVTPFITWLGTVDNQWNFFSSDWTNTITHVTGAYSDGSLVTFSDIGHTGIINLTTTYMPAGTTVENTNLNYTFTGSGAIMTNPITKIGPGTLILDNSGGDMYQGLSIGAGGMVQVGINDTNGSLGDPTKTIGDNGLLVLYRTNSLFAVNNTITGSGALSDIGANTLLLVGGNTFTGPLGVTPAAILQAGNATALGATNSPAYITNGASLDVNGSALAKTIWTQGIGATNPADGAFDGAIYNSAANSGTVGGVTLLGNVVFGCPVTNLAVGDVQSNRWDIRAPSGSSFVSTLSTVPSGSAYNITKIGANQVSLSGVTVDSGLGNIDVQGGMLSIETATTGLGNPANTLTVENGATLNAYQATNQFHKNIILNGNALYTHNLGTLNAWSGNNTVVGPLTLNGTVHVSFRTSAGAQNGATLVLSNSVTAMAGAGTLIKEDTNTLTVVGLDNHTGGTLVNDGTFILNGINSNTANTLMVNSHGLTIPAILGGNGTNSGMVTINDTLWPGVGGTPSTFGTKFLSFNGALNAYFSLGSQTTAGSGVNDLLNVGVFDPQGSVVFINPIGPLATGNTYTLVNYTSTTGSTFNNSPEVIPADEPSRYVFGVQQTGGNGPGHVTLTVTTGTGIMKWTGIANDTSSVSNVWDLEDVQTWTNTATSSPQSPQDYQFEQGDAVLFNDSIFGTIGTNVVVIETNNPNGTGPSPVMPSSITVSNTLVTNYTFTSAGGGSIGGTLTLTKTGTGSLTISEANTYSGTITINSGSLIVNNDTALGSYNTVIIVTNTGALDVGGASLGANDTNVVAERLVEIAGPGPGNGEGTLINSSANAQEDSMQNVLMTANASIGCNGPINGAGRFDIGRLSPATFSTGGNAYNLTKVGTNQVSFVGLTVDTNLANIDIQGGELGYETGTTGLGNPANTLTVESGAVLELYQETNALNKVIIVNGGALAQGTYENIQFNSGSVTQNVVIGPVTITNGIVVVGGGGDGTFSNAISGPGSLEIAGSVYLAATNTYTGNTSVSNGATLFLIGTGSINSSPAISLNSNATVDVTGLGNGSVLVLDNQRLSGNGIINGSLSNTVGSTVSIANANTNSAGIGVLAVTTNAWLAGTTVMKLDGNQTNDLLAVSNNITYGGTLVLTNISGSPLAIGNTWKLFNASTYDGTSAFTSVMPANPNNDATLAWDTSQLIVNGTIGIMSASIGPGTFTNPPGQLKITLNGANVSITGTGGQSGDAYYLLMSTNVALPKNLWQTVATNVLSANGNFTFTGTNVVTASGQQQFYLLSNTNAVH